MKQVYQILASTLIINSLSSSIYATNISFSYDIEADLLNVHPFDDKKQRINRYIRDHKLE